MLKSRLALSIALGCIGAGVGMSLGVAGSFFGFFFGAISGTVVFSTFGAVLGWFAVPCLVRFVFTAEGAWATRG